MEKAKVVDWTTKPLPKKQATIRLDRTFSREEMKRLRLGVIPHQMEDRWFVYWKYNKLFCHRSWTGICIFIIHFERVDERFKMVRADVNRNPKQFNQADHLAQGQTIDDADREWIDGVIDLVLQHDNDEEYNIHDYYTFHKSKEPQKIQKLMMKHCGKEVTWMRRPNAKAILVRVGVDHAYGRWNAPADPDSREFVYVPIPEKPGTPFHPRCKRNYDELMPHLNHFAAVRNFDLAKDLKFPSDLAGAAMHLDPDFEHLTYGDDGDKRGKEIRQLEEDDLLVFYAGLRPCRLSNGAILPEDPLIYAIIGLFVVDEVVNCAAVPECRWNENAHTRKQKRGEGDIVVRGKPLFSGRLARYIPIGEFRDRAYRVRRDLLDAWGGLSVKDGYIQRSVRPPRFKDANRFYDWFTQYHDDLGQKPELRQTNNPEAAPVVIVHLRRPNRSDPNETRADPYWEFGSFGCTGCHGHNMMNPRRIHELRGVRIAFAQGGSEGFKLVMVTPPVEVIERDSRCELRWTPARMPFRYDAAPVLVDGYGANTFKHLERMLRGVDRATWPQRFSSKFRSRREPLPHDVAAEMCAIFDSRYAQSPKSAIAKKYEDALPYAPNKVVQDREKAYAQVLKKAKGNIAASRHC